MCGTALICGNFTMKCELLGCPPWRHPCLTRTSNTRSEALLEKVRWNNIYSCRLCIVLLSPLEPIMLLIILVGRSLFIECILIVLARFCKCCVDLHFDTQLMASLPKEFEDYLLNPKHPLIERCWLGTNVREVLDLTTSTPIWRCGRDNPPPP